jgi:hypothetical protein
VKNRIKNQVWNEEAAAALSNGRCWYELDDWTRCVEALDNASSEIAPGDRKAFEELLERLDERYAEDEDPAGPRRRTAEKPNRTEGGGCGGRGGGRFRGLLAPLGNP